MSYETMHQFSKEKKILRVLNEDISIVVFDQIPAIKMDTNSSGTTVETPPSFYLPLVEDFVHCNKCDFDTLLKENLNTYMKVTHGDDVPPRRSNKVVDESISHAKDLDSDVAELKLQTQDALKNGLQGVPKKMRLGFCLISRQPNIGFSNRFFSPRN